MTFIEEKELKSGKYKKRLSSLLTTVQDEEIKELLGYIDRVGGIREDVLEFFEAHPEIEINRTVKEIYMKFLNNPEETSADWYEIVYMAYKQKEPEKLLFFCQSILFAISKQIPPDIVKTGLTEFDTPYQLRHYLKEYLKKENKSTVSEDEQKINEAINALAENLDIIISQKEESDRADQDLLRLVKEQSEEIKALRREQKQKPGVKEKSKEKEREEAAYYKNCYMEINEKLKKVQHSLTLFQLENKELKREMERREAQNKEGLSEIYETINQLQKKNKNLEEEAAFLKKALDEARDIKRQFEADKNKTAERAVYEKPSVSLADISKELEVNENTEEDAAENWEYTGTLQEETDYSREEIEALKEAEYFGFEEPGILRQAEGSDWEEPEMLQEPESDAWEDPEMLKESENSGWEEPEMLQEPESDAWEEPKMPQEATNVDFEEPEMLKEAKEVSIANETEQGGSLPKADTNTGPFTEKQKKISIKGAVSEKINRIIFFSEIITNTRRKKFEKLSGGRQTEAIYKLMVKNKFDGDRMDSVVKALKEGVSKEFIYEMIHKNPSMDEMDKMQSFFEKAGIAQA